MLVRPQLPTKTLRYLILLELNNLFLIQFLDLIKDCDLTVRFGFIILIVKFKVFDKFY